MSWRKKIPLLILTKRFLTMGLIPSIGSPLYNCCSRKGRNNKITSNFFYNWKGSWRNKPRNSQTVKRINSSLNMMMWRMNSSCKRSKKRRKSLQGIKILTITVGSSWISCMLNSTRSMTSGPLERDHEGKNKMKGQYQENRPLPVLLVKRISH